MAGVEPGGAGDRRLAGVGQRHGRARWSSNPWGMRARQRPRERGLAGGAPLPLWLCVVGPLNAQPLNPKTHTTKLARSCPPPAQRRGALPARARDLETLRPRKRARLPLPRDALALQVTGLRLCLGVLDLSHLCGLRLLVRSLPAGACGRGWGSGMCGQGDCRLGRIAWLGVLCERGREREAGLGGQGAWRGRGHAPKKGRGTRVTPTGHRGGVG